MNSSMQTPDELPHFMQQQFAFTDCIRDPEHTTVPDTIEPRRMAAYQEVVYNNIEDLLAHNFPVIREITSDIRWHSMVRDFVCNHRCHTPYFPQFGKEFIEYLQTVRDDPTDPPFLLELAHYEWMEIEIYFRDIEVTFSHINREGDLLQGQPVISPLAKKLSYRYPVQNISVDYQPQDPGDQVSCIVIYRRVGGEENVGFLEINPITDRLLTILAEDNQLTGKAALSQIADELNHPNPDVVISGGLETLQALKMHHIILGVRQE